MAKAGKLLAGCIVALVCVLAISTYGATAKQSAQPGKAEVSLKKIRQMRKKAAHRKRRIVFHSDGRPMDYEKMVFPHTVGMQVDAYTYSLVHQFNLARYYRSKVAQEVTTGEHLNHLDLYIDFCHKNNADAIWAMRMNDTHDAGNTPVYRKRFSSNKFKVTHPEFLVGSRENKPPNGRWSSVDFTHPEVREQVFRIWEEVCQNYDIDGLLFDFFRHLTYFKSTAWGENASEEETEMMTELFRRARKMADEIGAKRGKPILLIIRTPDSFGYCRSLGLDIEQWMKEGLIDIWLATGYFRLQEWEDTVTQASKYDIPVWASLDESRVRNRRANNTVEVYRARAMNAWRAGVDAIDLFNFFWLPPDPHMQLLSELGDIETIKYTDKTYYPDPRGRDGMAAGYWLKGGERFFTRPRVFTPKKPATLKRNEPQRINLLVGDDVSSAPANGFKVIDLTLRIQAKDLTSSDDIVVKLNNKVLKDCQLKDEMLHYGPIHPELVKLGKNLVEIALAGTAKAEPKLYDMSLTIKYEPIKK